MRRLSRERRETWLIKLEGRPRRVHRHHRPRLPGYWPTALDGLLKIIPLEKDGSEIKAYNIR
jgi:hypothetical protein